MDADVFCFQDAFFMLQEEVDEGYIIHLEEREAEEGPVDKGAEVVIFDGEHVSLRCISILLDGYLHAE